MKIHPLHFGIIALAVLLIGFVIAVTHRSQPRVIVNMPVDAKPLSSLAPTVGDKVIDNQRAVLWWTVFKNMSDRGYDQTAITAANEAVDKAYGPHP